jgi:hypothetical protein
MARASVNIGFGVLVKHAESYRQLAGPAAERVKKRTLATLQRRLRSEAARLLSEDVLNLTARQISPFLSTQLSTGDTLMLRGSTQRLPLSAFKPRPGPKGVIATLWRDSGPRVFEHTFIPKGGKQVWQRVPWSGQKGQGKRAAPSGLVQRTPIVVRKGPSFSRAVLSKKHGDIYPPLMQFAQSVLSEEIARLLKVEGV